MLYERIPWQEYAGIVNEFNPTKLNGEKWVLTAKRAGMKYMVITSKHHDVFIMFYSPSNDYNIIDRTPFKRDPMKELIAACRKHGLKFGCYYLLGRDWQDPDVPTQWPVKAGRSNRWDCPDEDGKVF
jgi:alpha-L-fucosidase